MSGGKHSRRKGRRGENEAVELLGGDARRISEAGTTGPDIQWRSRYGEVRRRRDTYQSLNRITAEFDGDTSFYLTRLDRGPWIFVAPLHEVLDMLEEGNR